MLIGYMLAVIPSFLMIAGGGIGFMVLMLRFCPHFDWEISICIGIFAGCVSLNYYWRFAIPIWRKWALAEGVNEQIINKWPQGDVEIDVMQLSEVIAF